jgi:WD40 repeat protein
MTVTPIPSPTVTFPAPLPFHGTLPSGVAMRFGLGEFGRPTLSPDGNYLAVTSGMGILLYRPGTLTEIGILPQDNYTGAIAWSPDSKKLAAVSSLKSITIWDIENARAVQTLAAFEVSRLAWSPDGKRLALANSARIIEVWNLNPTKLVQSFNRYESQADKWGRIVDLQWSTENEIISLYGEAVLWEVDSGKILHTWDELDYNAIALSPDKKVLALASLQSGQLLLWDLTSQKEQKIIPDLPPYIMEMSWSPDGKSIALATQFPSKLMFVDVDKEIVQKEFPTHVYSVGHLSWLKGGKELVTINQFGDGSVMTVWDIQTGQGMYGIRSLAASDMAWSSDGKTIAASGSGGVTLWDVQTGNPRLLFGELRNGVLDGGPSYTGIFRIALNPSANLLATELGDDSSTIQIWNTMTGELVEETWIGGYHHLDELSWLSDTQLIARTMGGDTLIWNAGDWENRQIINLDSLQPDRLDVSSDGKLVALIRGNTIEVRKLQDREIVYTWQIDFEHTPNLEWSPDGTKIVLIDTEVFSVYEADTGKRLNTLKHDGPYSGMKWSPDSTAIAYLTWAPDTSFPSLEGQRGTGRIYLWRIDTADAKLINTQESWYLFEENLCFSPDSKYLALSLWLRGLIVLRL